MTSELWWDDEDTAHIRHRSTRYSGATDLEPAWTLEAASDPHRLIREPNPKSRVGYTRIIGYSASAGFVLTAIVDPEDNSGVTAWKTRGADLATTSKARRHNHDRPHQGRPPSTTRSHPRPGR